MAELRWILLVAGVALIIAIWWKGRRPGAAAPDPFEVDGSERRTEPALDGASAASEPVELPALAAVGSDRIAFPASPPVVEIPAGVEPELAVAAGPRVAELPTMRAGEPLQRRDVATGIRPIAAPDGNHEERLGRERVQSVRRIDVTPGEVPPRRAGAAAQADAEAGLGTAPPESPLARQRIVALRVMSGDERWSGADLVAALQVEGLVFGRYSIYHRQRDDGRSIYCIASMVEPGSFDLDTIESETFPGISLFAVLPGPLDAPSTFDQMLATARRLADRLHGNLQDEHGSSLTAQRILNLREELVHFEHLLSRRPKRS